MAAGGVCAAGGVVVAAVGRAVCIPSRGSGPFWCALHRGQAWHWVDVQPRVQQHSTMHPVYPPATCPTLPLSEGFLILRCFHATNKTSSALTALTA